MRDDTFNPQAILLEVDLETEAHRLRLDELVRMGAVTIMPFGQYRGKRIDMIPDDYLVWAVKSFKGMTPDLRRAIKRHLIDR